MKAPEKNERRTAFQIQVHVDALLTARPKPNLAAVSTWSEELQSLLYEWRDALQKEELLAPKKLVATSNHTGLKYP